MKESFLKNKLVYIDYFLFSFVLLAILVIANIIFSNVFLIIASFISGICLIVYRFLDIKNERIQIKTLKQYNLILLSSFVLVGLITLIVSLTVDFQTVDQTILGAIYFICLFIQYITYFFLNKNYIEYKHKLLGTIVFVVIASANFILSLAITVVQLSGINQEELFDLNRIESYLFIIQGILLIVIFLPFRKNQNSKSGDFIK